MNFENTNRWLTLIANIGVLIGIAFLVIEVRQNTTALTASAYQSRSDALQEYSLTVAASDELATIEAELLTESDCDEPVRSCFIINEKYFQQLTPTQRVQYKRLLLAILFRTQNLVYQYKQGLLSDAYHDGAIIGVIKKFMPLWEKFDVWQRYSLVEHLEEYESR